LAGAGGVLLVAGAGAALAGGAPVAEGAELTAVLGESRPPLGAAGASLGALALGVCGEQAATKLLNDRTATDPSHRGFRMLHAYQLRVGRSSGAGLSGRRFRP
jgi:hypothetical protein